MKDTFIFFAPGYSNRTYINQMIHFGKRIRDEYIWQYPLLPEATYTYQQMAAGREWKMTGSERSVARAVEWVNEAQTLTNDGLVEYGFEQFLRRRSLDYLTVGRTLFTWGKGEPLRYLDPTDTYYYMEEKKWIARFTDEHFPVNQVVANHPIPVGSSGFFVSPISMVIPTAMLAWLIREHDRAAADGRKIRDILVVASKSMADQIADAVATTIKLWTGESDPSKVGVPVIYYESQSGMKADEVTARIGLANIPENFDRRDFQFQYVNEIASALGLALRHFWNSEAATNRALEEVQEARQAVKGPSTFARTEERLLNTCGALKQFGKVRFNFMEEVDVQSRKVNAEVLKLHAESVKLFAEAGLPIDGESYVSWLQSQDLLPSDLDVLKEVKQVNPEAQPIPEPGGIIARSDAQTQKSIVGDLEYDEIAMNGAGKVIERRYRVFSVEKHIYDQTVKSLLPEVPVTFESALIKARENDVELFKNKYSAFNNETYIQELLNKSVYDDDDYRTMRRLIEVEQTDAFEREILP